MENEPENPQGDENPETPEEAPEEQPVEKHSEGREIVTPGSLISTDPSLNSGRGALKSKEGIISLFVGLKEVRGKYVNVVPLTGLYNPNIGDKVIGVIIDRTPVKWLVDINAKDLASLKFNDASTHSKSHGSGKIGGSYKSQSESPVDLYKIGDMVICKVLSGDRLNEPEVSTLGQDLGKINSGMVVAIPPPKIPRLIGKKGSMIAMLKQLLDVKCMVSQNGRIWLRGKTFAHERLLMDVIKKIEREAHTTGLTDRIKFYIQNEKQKRGIV
jgi:exosome complex component RRP4